MKQALPKPWVFPGAYALLAVILFAAGLLAGFWHAPDRQVRTERVEVEAKVDSADDIRAMGAGQPVACAELNIPPELQCEGFQGSDFSVILVTP